MARNTLSNEEVSLIKALLNAGGRTNQEIAGLVNRARGDAKTDISSGRISNIKNDDIKKYVAVQPASKDALNAFVDKFEDAGEEGPVSQRALRKVLATDEANRLLNTESDRVECKKSFSLNFDGYIKTIAGFANNKGGYLLFGVKDGDFMVVGLTDDKLNKFRFDAKKFNEACRGFFRREIRFEKAIYAHGAGKIGVLYIHEETRKPVICQKGKDDTSEGAIYYRYPGESRLVGPQELDLIIEERVRRITESELASQIERILKFGVGNSAVLNLATGELEGSKDKLVVDEALLKKMQFIREGEFREKEGAPTLRVVGDVSSEVGSVRTKEDADYPHLPNEVVSIVSEKSGRKFTTHTHTNAWTKYKVRPAGGAQQKDQTDPRYCIYHEKRDYYAYSDEWINFLLDEFRSDEKYSEIVDFHKKGR